MAKKIDEIISGNRAMNIDGDAAPGKCFDLFKTLAMCCTIFKGKEE